MPGTENHLSVFWPLLLYGGLVGFLLVAILLLSYVLGQHHKDRATDEAVFIMLWALGLYDLGWAGYLGISIFVVQLVVVLIYEWGIGALDFGPDGKKIIKAYRKKFGIK